MCIATAQYGEDVQGYNSEFYEAWSNIKLVVDIGSGIAALPGLANGLVKIGTSTYQNGRSFMFSLVMNRAIRRTSLVDDFDVLGGLWKEKAVSRSFATGEDLEDMLTLYAPLTNAGSGTAQYVRISSFPAPVKSYIFAKNWDAATLGKLETDLENFALFNAVEGNKNLVDSWKVIESSDDLRVVINNLTRVDDYLKKYPNAVDAVKMHFDALSVTRKQQFINALEYASRDPLIIANARRANPSEISEAVNRIADKRGTSSGGNYGYVDCTLTGTYEPAFKKVFRSGAANTQTEPQVYTAVPATGSNGQTWLRNTDSEYKMLSDLAYRLGGRQVGDIFPNIGGSIKVVSENIYCPSCAGVIQQFHDMFPNVNLILVDGVK